jgi:phospholipid-binding lipoprotein MlaA
MPLQRGSRRLARGLGLVLLASSAGCASTAGLREPEDPWEDLNRVTFRFNKTVDDAFLKPAAELYQRVTPEPVDRAVTNVFSNVNDVVVVLNDLLQLKVEQAIADVGRLVMNTTFGLLGVFDVATFHGLEKHDEDFGQTLGYWGLGQGPYLMLPFLGPSTARDVVGLGADWFVSPVSTDDVALRNTLIGVKVIDGRADLLSVSRIAETAALDEYVFLRDAYLQRRRYQVYDGNPPALPFEEEPLGEDSAAEDSPRKSED